MCKNCVCKLLLEQLHLCSICDIAKVYFTSKISYLLFPNLSPQTGSAKASETTNNNLTEPIKPYSQSIAGVQFCFAFRQPQDLCAEMLCPHYFAQPNRQSFEYYSSFNSAPVELLLPIELLLHSR